MDGLTRANTWIDGGAPLGAGAEVCPELHVVDPDVATRRSGDPI
jgi:hypothetical protein